MLALVMTEKALCVPVQQRAGGDHLGVEQGMARQLAQEEPTMPVSPVHHRGDGEAAIRFWRAIEHFLDASGKGTALYMQPDEAGICDLW